MTIWTKAKLVDAKRAPRAELPSVRELFDPTVFNGARITLEMEKGSAELCMLMDAVLHAEVRRIEAAEQHAEQMAVQREILETQKAILEELRAQRSA